VNVLHIDEQMGWRGGEQQASWLIQGLCARGHHVIIAARPGSEFYRNAHGDAPIERLAVPLCSELGLYSAWRIGRLARRMNVDVFHAHTSHAHTVALLAQRFAGRGKTVVSRRVSFPPKTNPFNRWKYAMPDRIVGVSEHVTQILRENGVPESKLVTVHSSVDLERLNVPPLPRAELGIPEEVPLIVNAGSLVGHKDHANLLRAMARVLQALPEARLIIAGEGELRPDIEALIQKLAIGHAVLLLGHRTDVPRLVRAANLYVSSSWSEGLGTSILEALACQTPAVATEAGGAREMVKPGETGYLVPCRDPEQMAKAILHALSHPEEARAYAENGRALVERDFSTGGMVENTLSVYRSLLK